MAICECPHCHKQHKVPAKLLGTNARCISCSRSFKLAELEAHENDPFSPENLGVDRSNDKTSISPLPVRIGLKASSIIFMFVGFLGVVCTLVLTAVVTVDASKKTEAEITAIYMTLSPLLVGLLFSSLSLIWFGGVLQLGMAIESRIYENTRVSSALARLLEKK